MPTPVIVGPRLRHAEHLHATKYRLPGESFRDAMSRVASALADHDRRGHYHEFREILLDMRFMPAGRIQATMGSPREITPYNCFVGGMIPDTFTDADAVYGSSIMHRALEGARTLRMGGGLGNDFSTLRPAGAPIRRIQSVSTGPVSFMHIFDAIGTATSSTGQRRGAQMGVLRIDHPDIMTFINVKHDNSTLRRFNLSVAVTDEFMDHLQSGRPFPLRFGGEVYRHVDPEDLWDTLMRSTWDWGEPGVIFVDRINAQNNLWYCETIAATNPCSEQPLPPHGACLLGSFNLVRYLRPHGAGTLSNAGYYFDWDQLAYDVPSVLRAMDNVVDRALYPWPAQRDEAVNKRRMGLGGTGLANTVEALGHPYGSPEAVRWLDEFCSFLTRQVYMASTTLADQKGSFPLLDRDRYLQGQFVRSFDEDVQAAIARCGIRNSHLISWAPTGTISMCADNVSSSLEPVYQWHARRPVELPEGTVETDLYDYGFRELHVRGRRAARSEVTVAQHVDVLVTAQKHTDSAVSKTVNTDGTVPWEDFKQIYLDAYARGAKGCTTFNKDAKRLGLFVPEVEPDDLPFPDRDTGKTPHGDADPEACVFDPVSGRRTCE